MAAQVKQATGQDTTLVVGSPGEFTVWLGGTLIAEKKHGKFPAPDDVAAAVQAALGAQPTG